MSPMKRLLSLNIVLGAVSVFALILQYLALADIAKQETDVTLEWRIVGICMILMAAFVALTIFTLARMMKASDSNGVVADQTKTG